MNEKACTKCGIVKPLSEFNKGAGRLGCRPSCKECTRAACRDHARRNKKQRAEYQKKFQRELNPNYHKDYHYKKKYGISYVDYLQLVEESGGKCNICDTTEPKGKNGKFHLDHCHDSKVIRGVLCSQCNHAIGLFRDNPTLLRKAAKYLEQDTENG